MPPPSLFYADKMSGEWGRHSKLLERASAEDFEPQGSQRLGDQVGAWDGLLMPGESGASIRENGLGPAQSRPCGP